MNDTLAQRYAWTPTGMKPSDVEFGPMRYVREVDFDEQARLLRLLMAEHEATGMRLTIPECSTSRRNAREAHAAVAKALDEV